MLLKSKEVIKYNHYRNVGDKLCRQLIKLVGFSKGYNYENTHIDVRILEDNSIIVSTSCTNEYGSAWCNENYTEVAKSNIPYFTAKKLQLI